MWLYPCFLGAIMVTRKTLAAVIREARAIAGTSRDQLVSKIHPNHLHNLEYAKSGATLEKLAELSEALGTDPLALLVIASSYDLSITPQARLASISSEIDRLSDLGLVKGLAKHIQNGELTVERSGRSIPPEKLKAVLQCKDEGMSQKEAAELVGVSTATVSRIWRRT